MRKEYKCVSCGGELTYNPNGQNLICEYCESETALGELPQMTSFKREYKQDLVMEVDKDDTKVYQCASCGSKSIQEGEKELNRCGSCGSNDISKVNEATIHPRHIFPFVLGKKEAGTIFEKWVKTRKFAPNDFKKLAKLKKITGVYVPVYGFDYLNQYSYSGTGVNVYKDRNGRERRSTRPVSGSHSERKENMLKSASGKFTDKIIRKLEGYNPANVKPYSCEFMFGMVGTETDVNIHTAYESMVKEQENMNYNQAKMEARRGFDDVDWFRCDTTISDVSLSYSYAPVWANYYRYKKKHYYCYINGQSGIVYGKSPKSFWKILFLVLGIVAGVAAVAGVVSMFK